MGRLQDAIRLQTEAVQGAQSQVDTTRTELAKAETAVMGLIKVRDARLAQIDKAQGRREQAASDELATQLHLRQARTISEGVQPWQ
jgi:flagellar export protein FliJ